MIMKFQEKFFEMINLYDTVVSKFFLNHEIFSEFTKLKL